MGNDGCGEEDFLSQLPDDVLSHILGFLKYEDAIYAKLLSCRWRHIFPTNPTLCFNYYELRGNGRTFHRCPELISEPQKFVAWVDTVMQQFRAPKIKSFEIDMFVGGEYARSVDEWIRIACLMKAEKIVVVSNFNDPYIFPFHLLAGGSANLDHLELEKCSMRGLCPLWDQFLNLKSLVVKYSDGMEDFEISDVKLTKFKYTGSAKNISLKGLHCLMDLDIRSHWTGSTFVNFFSALPKEVPLLIRLSIYYFTWKEFHFPSYISTLKCLKYLSLGIKSDENADLSNLSTVLQVCPLLQEMNITFDSQHTEWPAGWLENRLRLDRLHKRLRPSNEEQDEYDMHHVHSHLKKVTIENTCFGKNDVELIISLLKFATSLEEIILDSEGEDQEAVVELQCALSQCYPTVEFVIGDVEYADDGDDDDDGGDGDDDDEEDVNDDGGVEDIDDDGLYDDEEDVDDDGGYDDDDDSEEESDDGGY